VGTVVITGGVPKEVRFVIRPFLVVILINGGRGVGSASLEARNQRLRSDKRQSRQGYA